MTLKPRDKLKNYTSLNAQIRDAESQIASRRHMVGARTKTLIEDIHSSITAPSSLLLAGEMGFIMAEFSKCPASNVPDTAGEAKAGQTETTLFTSSVNLMLSAYTLYKALPVNWLLRGFFQSDNAQIPAPRVNCEHPSGGVTSNYDRRLRDEE